MYVMRTPFKVIRPLPPFKSRMMNKSFII